MKILIIGGHITPALAVIENLENRNKIKNKYEFFFAGRKFALEGEKTISEEYKIIKEKNIPFFNLTTGRLQRSFTRYTFFSLLKTPIGFFQALNMINKIKPNVILSFGGYVSIPVCFVAWLKQIPIVTHEQTIIPGLANKIIGKIADKVCLSWKETEKYFPNSKTIITGNPVRKSIFSENKPNTINIENDNNVLYITGGSLGSHTINNLVKQMLNQLLVKYYVIHQCGDAKSYRDFDDLEDMKKKLDVKMQNKYYVEKYINEKNVGWILKKAKIIISRAGANTVSEIAALGKVAILIPLPWAGGNEQEENAKILKNIGCAEIINQEELTPNLLMERIQKIESNYELYDKNGKMAKQIINLNSAEEITNVIDEIYKKRNN